MTEMYGAALEFGHGRLYCVSNSHGAKVDRPFLNPDEDSLLRALEEFRPGLSHITLVQLDCPDENLTDSERSWRDISAASLKQRLGISVQRVTDIRLLVRGLAAQEEPIQFPYGVIILHDSDNNSRSGFVRKYRVTDGKHWKALLFPVKNGEASLVTVGGPGLPLSQSSTDVRDVIATFIADHPDIKRLVVWSPDGLPLQHSTYADNQMACQVTILNNHSFTLNTALRGA